MVANLVWRIHRDMGIWGDDGIWEYIYIIYIYIKYIYIYNIYIYICTLYVYNELNQHMECLCGWLRETIVGLPYLWPRKCPWQVFGSEILEAMASLWRFSSSNLRISNWRSLALLSFSNFWCSASNRAFNCLSLVLPGSWHASQGIASRVAKSEAAREHAVHMTPDSFRSTKPCPYFTTRAGSETLGGVTNAGCTPFRVYHVEDGW